ncbi:hypothetical protein GGH91_004369 [Coemansia sp. RSA 2671]|uniref:Uncharacterized protein n=1 Tax=Coemansia linderi TaxID=2663919 RepID=A0ACC1KDN7_9FUNG|nr:hypothetical protein GGH91_004369 [Coemansia sp. RSA 2671]KAJ2788403.1 hypothetical protein GGI18_002971 [Coemansia linderi]
MSLGPASASAMAAASPPILPTTTPPLSIALTRDQYALECGGVLLDPTTNEVCLLFYPDTSEWRLPIGRPTLTTDGPYEASVSGCEPPPHTAERLITQITGYRCTHLHPALRDCAYVGPHMVEPLALQIEQRSKPQGEPEVDESDENPAPRQGAGQYVMTCYYLAWLTQSRFEQRAATLPVGPSNGLLPLSEVTWFKMDTAAQVLSHASDKLALRETIHRMARCDIPRPPAPAPVEPPAEIAEEPVAPDSASGTESSAALSDAATKTVATSVAPRAASPGAARNLDLLRKTATSLGRRGGLLIRSGRSSGDVEKSADAAAVGRPASTPQELVARAKPQIPRVLSIFYKLVGSSSS